MNKYKAEDHPREPRGGRWTNKPETNRTASVNLTPSRTLSIDDEEFQELKDPLPHLDGARVKNSIDGREGRIVIDKNGWNDLNRAYVVYDDGRRIQHAYSFNDPVRIIGWDGDEQRLQDELEWKHLQQDKNRSAWVHDDLNHALEVMLHQGEKSNKQEQVYASENRVVVLVNKVDGSSGSHINCDPETGEIEYDKRKAPRIVSKSLPVIQTPEFRQYAQKLVAAQGQAWEAHQSYEDCCQVMEERYGARTR